MPRPSCPPGRSPNSARLATLTLILCGLLQAARAEDALLDQARALLERRDAAAAFALLAGAETARAGDARFDYLLGIAALDAGAVTRAVFALERVVEQRPQDALARAELGRAYLAAGDADAAREQWRLARAGELPAAAAAALERVLGAVERVAPSTRSRLSGQLEFGLAHDSNANSATPLGQFAIPAFGGILFETAPEHRQRADLALSAAGSLQAEKPWGPERSAFVALGARAHVHDVVRDMDTTVLDASAGLRHAAGRASHSLALQHQAVWVGGKGYRNATGVVAQWQLQLGPATQTSLFGQWARQAYRGQPQRDADRRLAGFGAARQFAGGARIAYGSAYAVQEAVHDPLQAHHGHRGHGLRLGAEQRLGPALVGFAEWSREQRRHGGSEPFFDIARRDRQRELSAGLRHALSPQWQLTAQARHTRLRSNVELYAYSREVIQLSLQRTFR